MLLQGSIRGYEKSGYEKSGPRFPFGRLMPFYYHIKNVSLRDEAKIAQGVTFTATVDLQKGELVG